MLNIQKFLANLPVKDLDYQIIRLLFASYPAFL